MKTHTLTAEAKAALKRKEPTNAKLLKMLLSNDEKDMPSSEVVRWLAMQALARRGFVADVTTVFKRWA